MHEPGGFDEAKGDRGHVLEGDERQELAGSGLVVEPASGDRKEVGGDIYLIETDWPAVGLPLVGPLGDGLFEVRSNLVNRIGRVIFGVDGGKMVLLHGFITKTRQTPQQDLDLARDRWAKWKKAKK